MGKYEYIDSLRNDPTETTPVWKMCLWLAVSTSGFYDWGSAEGLVDLRVYAASVAVGFMMSSNSTGVSFPSRR